MRRLDSVLSLLWKPLARLVYASPHCSPASQRDGLALAGRTIEGVLDEDSASGSESLRLQL